jgi:hypothetical protein
MQYFSIATCVVISQQKKREIFVLLVTNSYVRKIQKKKLTTIMIGISIIDPIRPENNWIRYGFNFFDPNRVGLTRPG